MTRKERGHRKRPSRSSKKSWIWTDSFLDIPGAGYFSRITNVSSINHIDFFQHCSPRYSQRDDFHKLWGERVLMAVKYSPAPQLSQQYKRLRSEWNERGKTTQYWKDVLEEEINRRKMPSGTGQEYAAQKNAVGQPANPSSHYHMQTRSPHELVCGSKTPGEKEPFQNPNFTQSRLVDPEIHIPELTESFLYYKNGTCISEVLLNYRQRQVESKSLLNSNQIKEIMSLSFVFFDPLICDLQEEERVRWRQSLGGNDRAFVSDLTEVCCRRKREEAMRALLVLGLKHDCIMSPLYLTAHSLLSTSILWADNVLDQDNEGSFIERFFKPLVNAFFGQFENARLCWINDVLKTGHVDIGERIVPKVMLSTSDPQHTVLVGEVTIPEASQHELNRNRVKLFIEMKHCLDGLLDYGVDSPVVGLLVQRHRVEVWSMTLPYEALYIPTKLGSFDLILSRFNFGTFFAMAPPLLAAKAIIQNSLTQLSRVRGWPLKSGWRRDTSALAPLPLGVTYPSTMRPLQRKRTGEDVNMQ